MNDKCMHIMLYNNYLIVNLNVYSFYYILNSVTELKYLANSFCPVPLCSGNLLYGPIRE